MGKFYAVKRGRKTGIFTSWEECKNSIDGYKNAVLNLLIHMMKLKLFER